MVAILWHACHLWRVIPYGGPWNFLKNHAGWFQFRILSIRNLRRLRSSVAAETKGLVNRPDGCRQMQNRGSKRAAAVICRQGRGQRQDHQSAGKSSVGSQSKSTVSAAYICYA